MLIVDGVHLRPSAAQFAALETRLTRELGSHGFILIRDLNEARFIARIEVVPNATDPAINDLVIREISPNRFKRLVRATAPGEIDRNDHVLKHDASRAAERALPSEFRSQP